MALPSLSEVGTTRIWLLEYGVKLCVRVRSFVRRSYCVNDILAREHLTETIIYEENTFSHVLRMCNLSSLCSTDYQCSTAERSWCYGGGEKSQRTLPRKSVGKIAKRRLAFKGEVFFSCCVFFVSCI